MKKILLTMHFSFNLLPLNENFALNGKWLFVGPFNFNGQTDENALIHFST